MMLLQTLVIAVLMVQTVLPASIHSNNRSVYTRQGLTEIPIPVDQSTTSLDVSHNSINKLDEFRLKYYGKLRHLDLSYNKFQSSHDLEEIEKLKSLTNLNLSGNEFRTLDLSILNQNIKLKHLTLEDMPYLFLLGKHIKARSLTHLSLRGSKIKHFPIFQFSPSKQLEFINIQETEITSLPEEMCKEFPKLRKILTNIRMENVHECLQTVAEYIEPANGNASASFQITALWCYLNIIMCQIVYFYLSRFAY